MVVKSEVLFRVNIFMKGYDSVDNIHCSYKV